MIIKPRTIEDIAKARKHANRPGGTPDDFDVMHVQRDIPKNQPNKDLDLSNDSASNFQIEELKDERFATPPTPDSANLPLIGLGLGALVGTVFAVWIVYTITTTVEVPEVETVITPIKEIFLQKKPIPVRITLQNKCSYSEKVFMVKVIPDGPEAEFHGGKAYLEARPDQKLKLLANERYPFLQYEDNAVNVAPEVTLTALCGDPEERMKALKKSFDETFSK